IGTAADVQHFARSVLRVTGNFSGVKVGRNSVPIDVQNGDPNVNIVAPRSVQVTVDELGSSTQAVSINRVHTLPSGFHEQTNATTVSPAIVRVDGPKSQLPGTQAVVVVDVENVTSSGPNLSGPVIVWDANKKPLTKGFTITPPSASVKVV